MAPKVGSVSVPPWSGVGPVVGNTGFAALLLVDSWRAGAGPPWTSLLVKTELRLNCSRFISFQLILLWFQSWLGFRGYLYFLLNSDLGVGSLKYEDVKDRKEGCLPSGSLLLLFWGLSLPSPPPGL